MDKIRSTDDIHKLLREADGASGTEIETILEKAARFEGLSPKNVAVLLMATDKRHTDRIFEIAGQIKEHIYGKRIVVFAPLYISDYCVNRCSYCGFRDDSGKERRKLTLEEIKREVAILERMGHKRLAVESGEDPVNCPLDYVLECIDAIYSTSDIRRVNVNIAALDAAGFRQLKEAKIGTYILFQETYNQAAYESVHKAGPKADYSYHLMALHRAMEAGIDDVGAGVLFGLYDYKYEVLALMLHNEELEKSFGVGFHTISVPRVRFAESWGGAFPYAVRDDDFLRLTAILRMAVPYTGMIVSTRETPEMRRRLVKLGITQMSAGSSAAVGGYSGSVDTGQFSLSDHREARDIFYWLMEEGILPSFCTACYRSGRIGGNFMELAKKGDIKNVCLPNGLLTLKEYALDHGDRRFNSLADTLITENLTDIGDGNIRNLVKSKLLDLENGRRDIFI